MNSSHIKHTEPTSVTCNPFTTTTLDYYTTVKVLNTGRINTHAYTQQVPRVLQVYMYNLYNVR